LAGFSFGLTGFDPALKNPRTIHHQGEGEFMVAARILHLPSPKTSLGGK